MIANEQITRSPNEPNTAGGSLLVTHFWWLGTLPMVHGAVRLRSKVA